MAETMVLADFPTLVEEEVAARIAIARARPVPPSPHADAQRISVLEAERRRRQIHEDEYPYRTALRAHADRARQAGRPGTPPPSFLFPEQAKLCHDFLDYMNERHDFAGATDLRNRARFNRSRNWSIRGYGIGVYPVAWDSLRNPSGAGSPQERIVTISPDVVMFDEVPPKEARSYEAMLPGTTGKLNAFLCEDDLVRLWISREAARGSESYAAPYTGDRPPSVLMELPNTNQPPRLQMRAAWLTRVLVDHAVEAELASLASFRMAGTTGARGTGGVPPPGWPPTSGPRHVFNTPPPGLSSGS